MFEQYVYKKPAVRFAIGLYDTAGNLVARKKPAKDLSSHKHIVSIILHQIGDVVMTLPSVAAIAELFPDAKQTLIVGKAPAALLKDNPWKADIVVFDAVWQKKVRQLGSYSQASDAKAAQKAFLELLAQQHPDAVLVFHPDLKVNQMLGKTEIPSSFGFTNAGAGFSLTHPISMPTTGHQVERNFTLVKAMAKAYGKSAPAITPPQLTLSKDILSQTEAKLKSLDVAANKRIVLHPFASDVTRNWNEQGWHEVILWLEVEGFQPLVIGSPQDNFTLPAGAKSTVTLCGKLTLEETAALISSSQLFIGVNSGPGHIAAALGCPVVSIFSSTHNPKRWAPYGQKNLVEILYVPSTDPRFTLPANRELELTSLPDGVEGNPFTDCITVEDVKKAAKKLLNPQKAS